MGTSFVFDDCIIQGNRISENRKCVYSADLCLKCRFLRMNAQNEERQRMLSDARQDPAKADNLRGRG